MKTEIRKLALVTGAGSGIGRCIVDELTAAGYLVIAGMREPSGRNRANAESIRQAHPQQARVLELDVCDDRSATACVEQVLAEAGRIDVLVNNAGIMFQGVSEAYDMAQAYDLMETNFFGAVRLNRLVLPSMRRQRSGALVHITSIAGSIVFPQAGLYSASKMATEGLAQSYRIELRPFGVDALVLQPCPYPTGLLDSQRAPADTDRLGDYGDLAQLTGRRIAATRRWNTSGKAPDPSEVGRVLRDLLDIPFGQRPFRTVAGQMDFGVRRLNALRAETEDGIARLLGTEPRP